MFYRSGYYKSFVLQYQILTFTFLLIHLTLRKKVLVFGVILVRIFPAFGLNTKRYTVSLRYSVRTRENTDQNNSEYGHFLRSANLKEITSFTWNLKLSELNYFKGTSFDINQIFILIMITYLSYIGTDASQSTTVIFSFNDILLRQWRFIIYVLLVLKKVAIASLLR